MKTAAKPRKKKKFTMSDLPKDLQTRAQASAKRLADVMMSEFNDIEWPSCNIVRYIVLEHAELQLMGLIMEEGRQRGEG